MNRVVLTADVLAQLQNAETMLEICDESGHTKGYVVPPELHREMVSAWAKSLFSDEEIERARREPGGMTTAEALSYLAKVASENRPA